MNQNLYFRCQKCNLLLFDKKITICPQCQDKCIFQKGSPTFLFHSVQKSFMAHFLKATNSRAASGFYLISE
jgi:hypothetical protein